MAYFIRLYVDAQDKERATSLHFALHNEQVDLGKGIMALLREYMLRE